MRSHVIAAFAAAIIAMVSLAGSEAPSLETLYPFPQGKLWGYIDLSGRQVVKAQFAKAEAFADGLGAVRLPSGKAGYIDAKARFVIAAVWDECWPFHDGLGRVRKGTLYGYVDKAGKTIIQASLQDAQDFHEGLASFLRPGGIFILDKNGKALPVSVKDSLSQFSEGLAFSGKAGAWAYYATNGKKAFDANYVEVYPFKNGRARFFDGKYYGFLDKNGRVVVRPEYSFARDYSEGLAVVMRDNRMGYIDTGGKLAIKMAFDSAWPFSEGLARVGVGEKIGWIDKTGAQAIGPRFEAGGDFHEGLAAFKQEGAFGFIDSVGRIVIDPSFTEVRVEGFNSGVAIVSDFVGEFYIDSTGTRLPMTPYASFSEGLAPALDEDSGLYGYVNPRGEWLIPPQFERAEGFSEGLAVIVSEGKRGYIDKKGTLVVKPQWDASTRFNGDFAVAEMNAAYGYIDTVGRVAISPEWDKATFFSEGLAAVARIDASARIDAGAQVAAGAQDPVEYWYYIDASGAQVFDRSFRLAGPFRAGWASIQTEENYALLSRGERIIPVSYQAMAGPFVDGFIPILVEGGWGYWSFDPLAKGAALISAFAGKYDFARGFSCALAAVQKDGLWGYINETGSLVIPCRYAEAGDFKDGIAFVSLPDSRRAYLDASGRKIWQE